MVSDALKGIRERWQDSEYRRAYGSTNIKYDLARALVEARSRAGYTQKQLADLSGVSQAYIAKLESGDANPTVGHIGALLATIWFRTEFKIEPLDTPSQWTESLEPSEQRPSGLEDAVIDGFQRNSGTADARYHAFSQTLQAHRSVSTVS